MVLVQVNLDEKENKLLNMYRLIYDLDSKEKAIKHLIKAQQERIEKIKKENRKYIEKAEKEADEMEDKIDEEELEAREELYGI